MRKLSSIKITDVNKILLSRYVIENYRNDYPTEYKISINDLITYLCRQNLGIYFNKIISEANNEFNKRHK